MNGRIRLKIIKNIAIGIVGVIIIFCCYRHIYDSRWEYSFAESDDWVKNHYQGGYIQVSTQEPQEVYEIKKENPTCYLLLVACDLRDEIEAEQISESGIDNLRQTLIIAQELGCSVIFRAAYDFDDEYEEPQFTVILEHIKQIGSILNEYKDCIAGVQAGMLGPYGEWHSSAYSENKEYYLQVITAWQNVLDKEIPISLRRQQFIRDAAEAGIDTTRIGIYNDGMFSSESDLGTYRGEYNREFELSWSKKNIYVPFNGGEMPYVTEYSNISNVVAEARQLKLSYLNLMYNTEVWKLWDSQTYEGMTGSEYLKKYLGIRPWVSTLSISENFTKRKNIQIDVDLCNSGFADMNEEYTAYFVMKYDDRTIESKADIKKIDTNRWMICGTIINGEYRKDKGNVEIGVRICRGTDDNRYYSVQLANEGSRFEDGINWLLELEG